MAESFWVKTRRSGLTVHRTPTSARGRQASREGKPARVPLGDPERPAPRARPASAAIPQRPRLTPSSRRARRPSHCCAHLPTARSACRWYQALLTPERPAPRARARLPTISSALASPSSGRTPSLLRTPPIGTLAPSSRAAVHNSARSPTPRAPQHPLTLHCSLCSQPLPGQPCALRRR